MLDEEFLEALPNDDIEAIIKFMEEFEKIPQGENLNEYIRAYTAMKSFAKNTNIQVNDIEFKGSDQDNMSNIRAYNNKVFDQAKIINLSRMLNIEEQNFKSIRDQVYEYEFSDNDYEKIQDHINKIRDLISKSKLLSEDHQNRLLKRLEQFQSELHKRVTNLDRALGFLLDVSIIVKQTGEGAKPIADLAKEISKILTQVILVSKGLPPGELPPLLK